jgi:hypothetical protein
MARRGGRISRCPLMGEWIGQAGRRDLLPPANTFWAFRPKGGGCVGSPAEEHLRPCKSGTAVCTVPIRTTAFPASSAKVWTHFLRGFHISIPGPLTRGAFAARFFIFSRGHCADMGFFKAAFVDGSGEPCERVLLRRKRSRSDGGRHRRLLRKRTTSGR